MICYLGAFFLFCDESDRMSFEKNIAENEALSIFVQKKFAKFKKNHYIGPSFGELVILPISKLFPLSFSLHICTYLLPCLSFWPELDHLDAQFVICRTVVPMNSGALIFANFLTCRKK
jgi:hypothetical protein